MPFPESPKVTYDKAPLEEVICQLRFNPILRIDTELPSTFQDAIRAEYPLFEEIKGHEQELPAEVRGQIPPEVLSLLRQAAELKKYNFASSNKAWTVTL